MAPEPYPFWLKNPRKQRTPDRVKLPDPGDENKTIASAPRRSRRPKLLDAGPFAADVGSFVLHLAAEGKAPSTIRNYTEAVRWFAGAHLLRETCKTRWKQVDTDDVRRWMVHLLGCYSDVYANGQYRGLQQFFKWLSAEDDLPDPMDKLRGPKVTEKMVPVFTSVELSQLAKACRGNTFADRRDAAIIAVFRATGIRLSELAGICYVPDDPSRTDVDLGGREIRIRGKGGKGRIVKIGHEGARAVDRYLRVRIKHAHAYLPQLWLGVNNRGPLTSAGVYQAVARRGEQCGVAVYPHRFRHHFSPLPVFRPRRPRRRPDGTMRLDLPADAAPLRRQRPQRPRPAHLRPHHGGPAMTSPPPAARQMVGAITATRPPTTPRRPGSVPAGSALACGRLTRSSA